MLLQQRSDNQIILSADLWVACNFYVETLQRGLYIDLQSISLEFNQHWFEVDAKNVSCWWMKSHRVIVWVFTATLFLLMLEEIPWPTLYINLLSMYINEDGLNTQLSAKWILFTKYMSECLCWTYCISSNIFSIYCYLLAEIYSNTNISVISANQTVLSAMHLCWSDSKLYQVFNISLCLKFDREMFYHIPSFLQ